MKVRSYGALMGALLTISAADAADAATCGCVDKPHHAAPRHAPAHRVRHAYGADAEYARSFYDYHSASRVGEVFVRQDVAQEDGWRVAPNDAHIRFYHDERVIYGPGAAPQSYYSPQGYYPAPPPGIPVDEQGFNGGVGYGDMAGDGGGNGGQAFLYSGQSGGQDEPSNGGGVNLPSGYGPTYRGNWSGQGAPRQGGGAGIARTSK